MNEIYVDLSTTGINKALKEIERRKKEIQQMIQSLIEKMVDYGIEIAQATVIDMGAYFSGELARSIDGYYSPSLNAGFVRATADYACYVEFGTGVKGKGSPHPAPQGWKYDVNNHGEQGWFYFKDGAWHWTRGMQSRPFMYETLKELEQIVENVALEVRYAP